MELSPLLEDGDAALLKALVAAYGGTHAWWAERFGIAMSTLSGWSIGRRMLPKYASVIRLLLLVPEENRTGVKDKLALNGVKAWYLAAEAFGVMLSPAMLDVTYALGASGFRALFGCDEATADALLAAFTGAQKANRHNSK